MQINQTFGLVLKIDPLFYEKAKIFIYIRGIMGEPKFSMQSNKC